MSNRTLPARITGALAIVGLSSFASAATLVDYKPLPVSPTTPEFVFGGAGPSFAAGPGATSNGDGVLPVPAQTAGGLDAETPFVIPAIPGGLIHPVPGTTEFYDSTLAFTGLAANAPAVAAGGVFIQSLGPGTFSLFSTTAGGGPVLLLSGTIAASSFIVGSGDAAGEFNSFGVTYTGGAILPAMLAAGGVATGNSMSISMTDVSPTLGIGPGGFLNPFTANGTGLFNYSVPEPTSLAVLGLAGMVAVRRRLKV